MAKIDRTMNFLSSPFAAFLILAGLIGHAQGETVDPKAFVGPPESIMGKGPNGEEPLPANSVSLSAEELKKIQGLNAKAAIAMHYSSDWSQAQVDGLKWQFDKMGVEVIAVTDAGFNPERQVAEIQTVLAQNPQIIVSIPTDADLTAAAYRKASEKGVKLVFMDNVPTGFSAGKDYVSVVSADNYGNGVASARLMGDALQGKGQIGLVYHAANFFVTRQRYDAFKKTITDHYPGITIVAEEGIRAPDFFKEGNRAAAAMLTANPNLSGIWAVWDVPAEGVITAARVAHRDDLVVTTIDLGLDVAVEMASKKFIKGVGAQRPYDQGVTEAILAGYGLLNKPAPAYVALPALPVTRENLLEAWKIVYHSDAPARLGKAMAPP
jgi:ribose transport system substrate-binding protein